MKLNEKYREQIKSSRACESPVKWLAGYDDEQTAWDACDRPDWMLWLLGKLVKAGQYSRKRLVMSSCKCARTSLQYVKPGETRPLKAIEAAEAWASDAPDVTLDMVEQAADAADAAADAADAAYAAYAAAHAAAAAYAAYAAAHAAAHAAHAAAAAYTDAADAAADAADAAYAAAAAAGAADAAGACLEANRLMAGIIRADVPDAPIIVQPNRKDRTNGKNKGLCRLMCGLRG